MASVEELQALSGKIDALFDSGRDEEGQKLLEVALKAAQDNDAYSLFFLGEQAHYNGDDEMARHKNETAVALAPLDPFLLHNYGIILVHLNLFKESIALFDQALDISPKDFHLLRSKGVSLAKLGLIEESITFFDQALEVNPKDFHSLRHKGVSLSELGRDKEASALFEQALEINPKDFHSLRQKGTLLSKLGHEEEAMALYDQALSINPRDFHSLRHKGILLSKLGREEEAIALFNQALDIDPKDSRSLRNKSVALFNIDQKIGAYKAICAALALDPVNERYRNDASFVYSQLSPSEKATVAEETAGAAKPDPQNLGGLKGFIQTVRTAFESEIANFENEKEQNERHLQEFIMAPSRLDGGRSIFLVLRKWNSYTPALPLDSGEKSLGGGYFIFHHGHGTVIDPGYNFIENFHRADCRLQDIDNILITHAHNDHTIDFESLLTLLYQAHKEKGGTVKKVNLYLNPGALLKFGSLLDWRAKKSINVIRTIHAGNTYTLDGQGTVLTVLPAYHDEIVTRYYAVGLHFSFDFGAEGKRNLLLTSDTGLYPSKEDNETEEERSQRRVEIHERYRVLNPELVKDIDLLIPHLGSIGEKELKPMDDLKLDKDSWQEEDLLYGNHLGVLGVLRMVSEIRPNVALISEFGEELKTFRGKLLELMQRVINGVIEGERKPKLLPADLPFIYNIKEKTIFCVASGEMKSADQMLFGEEDGTFYYYYDQKTLDRSTLLKDQYKKIGKPYLKSDAPSAAS